MLEPELEKVVRKFIRRGTILIHIRADRTMGSHEGVVHAKVLASYITQVHHICQSAGYPRECSSHSEPGAGLAGCCVRRRPNGPAR